MTQRALSNNGSPEFSSYHLRLEAAAQRVKLLEEKVDRLQSELDKVWTCDFVHAIRHETPPILGTRIQTRFGGGGSALTRCQQTDGRRMQAR